MLRPYWLDRGRLMRACHRRLPLPLDLLNGWRRSDAPVLRFSARWLLLLKGERWPASSGVAGRLFSARDFPPPGEDESQAEPDASLEVRSSSALAGRAASVRGCRPPDRPASAFTWHPKAPGTRPRFSPADARIAPAVFRSCESRREATVASGSCSPPPHRSCIAALMDTRCTATGVLRPARPGREKAPGGAPEVRPFAVLFLSAGENAFPHSRTHLPLSERPPRHLSLGRGIGRPFLRLSSRPLCKQMTVDRGRSNPASGFYPDGQSVPGGHAILASGRYCLGLGLFQVFGHDRGAPRLRSTRPQPSASGALGPLLSARGFLGERKDTSRAAAAGHIQRPPALQRLHGADA